MFAETSTQLKGSKLRAKMTESVLLIASEREQKTDKAHSHPSKRFSIGWKFVRRGALFEANSAVATSHRHREYGPYLVRL